MSPLRPFPYLKSTFRSKASCRSRTEWPASTGEHSEFLFFRLMFIHRHSSLYDWTTCHPKSGLTSAALHFSVSVEVWNCHHGAIGTSKGQAYCSRPRGVLKPRSSRRFVPTAQLPPSVMLPNGVSSGPRILMRVLPTVGPDAGNTLTGGTTETLLLPVRVTILTSPENRTFTCPISGKPLSSVGVGLAAICGKRGNWRRGVGYSEGAIRRTN